MANQEQNLGERASTGIRNLFIIGALIGVSAMILRAPFGETIFERSVVGAAAGEGGRRLSGVGKKK